MQSSAVSVHRRYSEVVQRAWVALISSISNRIQRRARHKAVAFPEFTESDHAPDNEAAVDKDTAAPVPTPLRPAGRRRKEDGLTWEETHRRATFHLSVTLHEAIAAEADRSGRTKSQVVTDALRQHLQVDGAPPD